MWDQDYKVANKFNILIMSNGTASCGAVDKIQISSRGFGIG
jgi:hypothetical protein